jgi:hypothetical protein
MRIVDMATEDRSAVADPIRLNPSIFPCAEIVVSNRGGLSKKENVRDHGINPSNVMIARGCLNKRLDE